MTTTTAPSIALVGICCDHNSSFARGAASAPEYIRTALYSESSTLTAEDGTPLEEISIIDFGDFHIAETDDDYLAISKKISPLVDAGHIPLVLGGDHSITFPVLQELGKKHECINILQFDAHPDLYDAFAMNRYSHACPFARIMEEKSDSRLIQVGIRCQNAHQAEQAKRFGVQSYQMRDFPWHNFLLDLSAPLYISIDLDVLDPAFAPGVSHLEPGGMSVRDLITIIQSLRCSIIGADIVEYNPHRDVNSMTAMVAAKCVKELAAKMVRSSNK